MKTHRNGFTQAISMLNSRHIRTFIRRFSVHLGFQTESHGPKIKIFKNEKKHHQGFTQAMNMPNFRHTRSFMPSLEHPKSFVVHLGSRAMCPKHKN